MNRFNIQQAERLSKNKEIISFDIYDTLVKRNVSSPTMVFDIVGRECSKKINTILNFREARLMAEKKAREVHEGQEVTLDEIYSQLDLPYKTEIKEVERTIELEICEPNYPVLEFYKKCVFDKKRVIIISDMYLPRSDIERILNKCGITGYEKLYVSSEIGVEKRTGKLYDYVLKDLGVLPKKIIHFGDRKKTDNIIPRMKGIHSFYVHPRIINTNIVMSEKTVKDSTIYNFVNNQLPKYNKESELFQYGYEAFGPLLLGYCTWVHKKIEETGVARAYFLARDMNLVVQIYRRLYGEVNTDYLEISRKSLRNDYIISQNRLDAVFDTVVRRQYTSKEILDILGIDEKSFDELCKSEKIKFNLTQKFYPYYKIPNCFTKIDIKDIPLLKKDKGYSIRYLTKHGLFENGKIAIVDIGWHGTIQNMLEKMTGKQIVGLYFGSTKRMNYDEMEMYGYWFEEDDETKTSEFTTMTSILEAMLFPTVGTTVGYKISEGDIVPVYGVCETSDFTPIADFQRGAMTFIDDYIKTNLFDFEDIGRFEAVNAYWQMANYPSLSQAKAFANIIYEDGKEYTLA